MNISHLVENEFTNNDDFNYQTKANTINKPNDEASKAALVSEMLILLDDATPNYVLGYN